jgi:hypothetical protein
MHTRCFGLERFIYSGPFLEGNKDWLGFAIPFLAVFPGFGCMRTSM